MKMFSYDYASEYIASSNCESLEGLTQECVVGLSAHLLHVLNEIAR